MVGSGAVTSLLVSLHILCMSLPATAPLLAAWFEFREGRGDREAGALGRRLLGASLGLLLVGVVLGLLVGWLRWNQGLADALDRLSSRVFFGVLELTFSSLVILGHWLWWRRAPNASRGWRGVRSLLGLLAGANLLYHFPVLFVVITHLIHQGESLGEAIGAADFRRILADPAVTARVAHIVLAHLAAGGVAIVAIANWLPVTWAGEDAEWHRRRFTAWGARWTIVPTVAQVPTGLWVLTQLSPVAQNRLLGGDLAAGALFVIGVASALWLLHLLASLCLGEHNPSLCRRTVLVFVLTIVLMTQSSRRVMSMAVPRVNAAAVPARAVAGEAPAEASHASHGRGFPQEG